MGKRATRECSRIGPIGRRWFGARRERRRGFGLGERGERLEGARIELGGGGSRRGVRGFGSLCPLLLNHRESAEKRWVWGFQCIGVMVVVYLYCILGFEEIS